MSQPIKTTDSSTFKAELPEEIRDSIEAAKRVNDWMGKNPEVASKCGYHAPMSAMEALDHYTDQALQIFRNNGFTDAEMREFKTTAAPEAGAHPLDKKRRTVGEFVQNLTDAMAELQVKDAAMTKVDHSNVLKRVVSTLMEMPQEPPISLVSLFRPVSIPGAQPGGAIQFPIVGSFKVEKMNLGVEYPEQKINFDSRKFSTWGKYGVALRFPDEMVGMTMFNIIALHTGQVGAAFRRNKEEVCALELEANADPVIDASGAFGLGGSAASGTVQPLGNNAKGKKNGTFTIHDLWVMYTKLIERGLIPNTIAMHPIGWPIFASSPEMRSLAQHNGSGNWYQPVSGGLGRYGAGGPLGTELGGNNVRQDIQGTMSADVPPGIFPNAFRMISSPFLNFNPDARSNQSVGVPTPTVDMLMLDSDRAGFLVTDPLGYRTQTWNEHAYDFTKMSFAEYFSCLANIDGDGVISAVNIPATRFSVDLLSRMAPQIDALDATVEIGPAAEPGT